MKTPSLRQIGAIVLAAGNSSRMGSAGPKQLLDYEGESLLRRAAQTARVCAFDPVVVVLGANADRIRRTILEMPIDIVENVRWHVGMGSSLKTGLARVLEIAASVDAVIVMLCDQPLVGSEEMRTLVQTHLQTGRPLVAAAYGGTVGVPALIGKAYFETVRKLPEGAGAKALFAQHSDDVARVPMQNAAVDIDEPGDYEKAVGKRG